MIIPPRHNPAPIFQVLALAPKSCPAPTISSYSPRIHTSSLNRSSNNINTKENNGNISTIDQTELAIDEIHETSIREISRRSANLRRQKEKELTRDEQIKVGWLLGTCSTNCVTDHLCKGTKEEDGEEATFDLLSVADSIEKTNPEGDGIGDTHDDGCRKVGVVTVVVPGS